MASVKERRQAFRALLAKPGCEIVPSCYDGLGAMLIERAGFPAIHISGSGVHRSYGFGDVGVLTLTEQVAQACVLNDMVNIPILADCETGHGNVVNTVRAVREFERSGVAAIHIEDQETPKRPTQDGMEGGYVSKDEFVGKIKAAVDTRPDQLFSIVARIDRRAVESMDQVLEVGLACCEAGADAIWMGLRTPEDQALAGKTMTKPMVGIPRRAPEGWRQRYGDMGYKLALVPGVLGQAASWAMFNALQALKETDTETNFLDRVDGFKELAAWFQAIGMEQTQSIEDKYMNIAAAKS